MKTGPENLRPSYSVLYGDPGPAVNNFYRSVYRNPGAFLLAIESLAYEPSNKSTPSSNRATNRITEFMSEGHDLNIKYDDTTEAILESDKDHHTRINKLKSSNTEDREARRNDVRYSRLAHFMRRVVEWEESQKSLHQVA